MRLILLLPALLFPLFAQAGPLSGVLPVLQMNPAMLRYFDPQPQAAATGAEGDISLQVDQHYASIILADSLPAPVRFLADMEIYLAQLKLTYSPSDRLDVGATVPLIYAHAGILDAAIRQFHNAFGMPDNGRYLRPDNSFGYFFNGAAGGWSGSPGWAVGNVELSLKYRTWHEENLDIAIMAAAKLPTGNRSQGWSSGSGDVAAGAAFSHENDTLFQHLNIWAVKPLSGTDYGYRVKPYLRGSLTLGWKPEWLGSMLATPLALLIQAQGGSSPYRTGVLALDRPPWLISFGARFAGDSGRLWSLSFIENITQQSTQDFGISVGVELPVD